MNFELNLDNSSGNTNSYTLAEISVNLNNNQTIYAITRENTTNNNQQLTGFITSVSLEVGDVLYITMYNKAESSTDLISKTVMTSEVTDVQPNGEIGAIYPSTIENKVIY